MWVESSSSNPSAWAAPAVPAELSTILAMPRAATSESAWTTATFPPVELLHQCAELGNQRIMPQETASPAELIAPGLGFSHNPAFFGNHYNFNLINKDFTSDFATSMSALTLSPGHNFTLDSYSAFPTGTYYSPS
jgi:hypothetical protein